MVCNFALRGKDSDVNHPKFPSLLNRVVLGEPVNLQAALMKKQLSEVFQKQFPSYLNEIIRY